jgi:HupE / UreJ protein
LKLSSTPFEGKQRRDRVAGILAFNLGIETMQMLVVAIVLPSLMLMSFTGGDCWYWLFAESFERGVCADRG